MVMNRQEIWRQIRQILGDNPEGMRWSDILRAAHSVDPTTPWNSVHGAAYALFSSADDIVKPSKGFYRLKVYDEEDSEAGGTGDVVTPDLPPITPTVRESDYYAPFAAWLRDDLNDVSDAVAVGGAIFKDKWGTPDVIGVLKPQADDLVKFDLSIVSAEIKTDSYHVITAFGQAVAYKLFSHKSYIVVPSRCSVPDLERLTALSSLYGIGLVTFDLDPMNPNFTLRVNALSSLPDMSYVNEMARLFSKSHTVEFRRLF